MVEKRFQVKMRGVVIPFKLRYKIVDWHNRFEMNELGITNPTYFVQYSAANDVATVDNHAPNWYIDLATLAAHIFFTDKYDKDINRVSNREITKSGSRCADVERFVISLCGERLAKSYIKARIAMYEDILNDIIEPKLDIGLRKQYKYALEVLKAAA